MGDRGGVLTLIPSTTTRSRRVPWRSFPVGDPATTAGVGDIDSDIDIDIDIDIDADIDDAGGAVAYGAPGDSAAAGEHMHNPFYFAVPATSSAASSSSAPAVKQPLRRLLLWHVRLGGFTGPTIRRALPAVPTHSQHAESAFGHLWLDNRKLPVWLYDYLKAVLGGEGDLGIAAPAESRFRVSMGPALPRKTRQSAPLLEEESNWGVKGSNVPYKQDTLCRAIQKSDGKACQKQSTKGCKSGKCGVSGHCPDKSCHPHHQHRPAHPKR